MVKKRPLPPAAWTTEYCISAGVSGRSVNQIRTLTALTNMGQLAPIVENMTETLGPSAVKDFYLWIFNTLDTELARRVMATAGKGDLNAQRSTSNSQRSSVEAE